MIRIVFTGIFILYVSFAFGQPEPPGPVPADGGLGLLLVTGIVYGIKRWKDAG